MYRQIANSGEIIDWTIVVNNTGKSPAKASYGEVFITDDLKPIIKILPTPIVSKGFYRFDEHKWVIGDLYPEQSETIKLQVQVLDINVFNTYNELNVYFKVYCECDESMLDNDVCLTIFKEAECGIDDINIG